MRTPVNSLPNTWNLTNELVFGFVNFVTLYRRLVVTNASTRAQVFQEWCSFLQGDKSVCESTFLEIYFFKNCPEGNICGTFLKKRQKCTSSKVSFDQKLR